MLLRSTLIYAPAILFTRLSALLLVAVATRLLDQTEYGLLTLVVTIGEMTDVAVTNWLRVSLIRLGGKGEISRGSVALAGRVLLVTTPLALIVSTAAARLVVPDRWIEFAAAVAAYLVVGAISRFALSILQMQQRHSAYSVIEFLRAVLQLALPIAAAFAYPGTFLSLSLASSLGVLAAGVVAFIVAMQRVVLGPPRFSTREFIAFGIPLVVTAIAGFGASNVERLFLNAYFDASAVAVFAVAYALARQPIEMVASSVHMGAFPEMVGRFDENGPKAASAYLSEMLALMMRLCLPVAALLVALSSDIAGLVLPAGYHGHVEMLFPIIAFSVVLAVAARFVFADVIHAHKKLWLLVLVNGAGTLATVALSILLVPSLAEIGAAFAFMGGVLAILGTSVLISRRLTPIVVPWKDLGISAAVALLVGLAGYAGSMAAGDTLHVYRLLAGGTAGGLAFVAASALLFPEATRSVAHKIFARLRGGGLTQTAGGDASPVGATTPTK